MDKRVSAKICGFLRVSAKICGFLRKSEPPKCCNPEEKRKSAKISENLRKTANSALFVPFSLSLLVPLCFQAFFMDFHGSCAMKIHEKCPKNPLIIEKIQDVSGGFQIPPFAILGAALFSKGWQIAADLLHDLLPLHVECRALVQNRQLPQRATGVSRALRARNPKKVWKKSLWPRGPQKSGKSLEKVQKAWKKSRECPFETFSRPFPDFSEPWGPRPRETLVRLLFLVSGPPRDSCSSSGGSQGRCSSFSGKCSHDPWPEYFCKRTQMGVAPWCKWWCTYYFLPRGGNAFAKVPCSAQICQIKFPGVQTWHWHWHLIQIRSFPE